MAILGSWGWGTISAPFLSSVVTCAAGVRVAGWPENRASWQEVGWGGHGAPPPCHPLLGSHRVPSRPGRPVPAQILHVEGASMGGRGPEAHARAVLGAIGTLPDKGIWGPRQIRCSRDELLFRLPLILSGSSRHRCVKENRLTLARKGLREAVRPFGQDYKVPGTAAVCVCRKCGVVDGGGRQGLCAAPRLSGG